MSLKKAAESVRKAGRGPDTELVHFTKNETAGLHALARAAGGSLTRNPKTGLIEAGFLESMLPTILGGAAMFIPGMQPVGAAMIGGAAGAITNKKDPWMGALTGAAGGYGAAGLTSGVAGYGANAAAAQGAAGGLAQPAGAGLQAAAGSGQTLQLQGLTGQGLNATGQTGLQAAAAPSTTAATTNTAAGDAARAAYEAKPFYQQVGGGISAGVDNPSGLIDSMGGGQAVAKKAAMAAAPAMMYKGETKGPNKGTRRGYNYDAGYTGGEYVGEDPTSEQRWFDPNFTRTYAQGGTTMSEGGFVIPADVVSMLGNGSSDAGLEALAKHLGATPIDGPGDGMSDSIPASIDGAEPAAVARQEAYLSPERVQQLGGTDALYAMIERVRQQAHGKPTQQRQVDPGQVLA
jgi:hypothetical protein